MTLSSPPSAPLPPALLRDDAARHRYAIDFEGQAVFADYRLEGGKLSILHVESPPALRGRGAAGQLMRAIAEKAAAEGWHIHPVCGYAAAWLKRHPQ